MELISSSFFVLCHHFYIPITRHCKRKPLSCFIFCSLNGTLSFQISASIVLLSNQIYAKGGHHPFLSERPFLVIEFNRVRYSPPLLSVLWHCLFYSLILIIIWHTCKHCFIALCFIAFHRDCVFKKYWWFVATLCRASLSAPFFHSWCSLWVSVLHFGNSRNISNLSLLSYLVMVICGQGFWRKYNYYCN